MEEKIVELNVDKIGQIMKPHYLMQFFTYSHLPDELKNVSHKFCSLAYTLDHELSSNPEKTMMRRKLLEAKDCAVRAVLFKKDADPFVKE